MIPLAFREDRRRLLTLGFVEAGQSGSHVKFVKVIDSGTRTTIVPKHREVAAGTLRDILLQVGVSEKEFNNL